MLMCDWLGIFLLMRHENEYDDKPCVMELMMMYDELCNWLTLAP